ncbi:hypothetical protein L7F22_052713 [Adiantum nelumboides]|nr:hypothetical protein [Adiantum nelumboides]
MLPGGIIKDEYYFLTNKDSKNKKIAKIKLDWSKARTVQNFTQLQDRPEVIDVIAERKDALINYDGFRITDGDKGVVTYVENGQNTVYLYDLKTGKVIQRLLPNEQLAFFDIRNDQNSNILIMSFFSWNSPSKIFEFEWENGQIETSSVFIGEINGINANDFAIEEFYATSKDDLTILILFGVMMDIWFGAEGGGDEGGDWHEAAQGLKKQKTFDDTLAILEDLVKKKITSPGNLILEGISVGGMAVGAVINQAPEGLIGAAFMVEAICDVFQLELRTSIGQGNVAEFGDVTTPEGFDAVRAWSPLQNVNPKKQYPAILLTSRSLDEQVPPSSSFKFISELQYTHPNNKFPLLLYLVPTDSHLDATILELTYQFCILEEALGIKRRSA